jgi:sugar lactone lactonase YvrE
MISCAARVLFRPPTPDLRYLPEGPYPCGPGVVSWVAIQHGANATRGSLNLLDVGAGSNRSFPLEGRPGFAFPTSDPGTFLIGCEKRVGFLDLGRGSWVGPSASVESDVEGTIVNDALFHRDAVIFGTKDLAFERPRAGLYFWRPARGLLRRLADGQICSNGKVVIEEGERVRLLDIDTPTRLVVEYPLDLEHGRVGARRVVLDLTDDPAYPDGMITTPDRKGVVIAFYDPDSAEAGEARQYDPATGEVQTVAAASRESAALKSWNNKVVRPGRFERPTYRFVARTGALPSAPADRLRPDVGRRGALCTRLVCELGAAASVPTWGPSRGVSMAAPSGTHGVQVRVSSDSQPARLMTTSDTSSCQRASPTKVSTAPSSRCATSAAGRPAVSRRLPSNRSSPKNASPSFRASVTPSEYTTRASPAPRSTDCSSYVAVVGMPSAGPPAGSGWTWPGPTTSGGMCPAFTRRIRDDPGSSSR